jgi:uncharacterized protein (DUF362 family)/Pyruvate/2-oxoacid:ferredoxin oxidoreductase delta subunit
MTNPNGRARVAIARCGSYDLLGVARAVDEVLEPFGGMGSFVRPGQNVLLKPNLLSAKAPERAITTHPSVLEVLAARVREAGGSPVIGDSPGGAIRGVERVWENTGMQDLSERTGVPLVSFEAAGSVETRGELGSYMIARPVLDADVIVNVPKMKTHVLVLFTGCVKNTYGAVPGFGKGRLHSVAPRPGPFGRIIADVHALVRPAVHVVDAVLAMEGDGPSGGSPRKVGAILAGTDPVAVDSVLEGMIGIREGRAPVTKAAVARGLGEMRRSEIEIVGADPSSFDLADFKLPRAGLLNLIPAPLIHALRPWIWVYPEMSKERGCRGTDCALCGRSCPVGASSMRDGTPYVDRKPCVECLCCHEVCPHDAVQVRLSWLAKKFS